MDLRKDVYNGQQIDIAPHVKYGSLPKQLRVYYCALPAERLIVVGHCGDHLETAGTRKLK